MISESITPWGPPISGDSLNVNREKSTAIAVLNSISAIACAQRTYQPGSHVLAANDIMESLNATNAWQHLLLCNHRTFTSSGPTWPTQLRGPSLKGRKVLYGELPAG